MRKSKSKSRSKRKIKKINKPIYAICVLQSEKINGIIYLTEIYEQTTIYGTVSGLTPNKLHGFHIHEAGDLTEGCKSVCDHYNPFKSVHGGRYSCERHVGDLGNLEADSHGNCSFTFTDDLVRLSGKYSVMGRSLVIHEDEDDLGLGGRKDSLTTGHSGKRLVCGIIGYKRC